MESLEELLKSASLCDALPYPLADRFISLHRSAGDELMDAENHRELYLRIMERIVRIAVEWLDGTEHAKWNVSGNAAVGRMECGGAIVTASERLHLQDAPNIANRNGIYRLLTAESPSGALDMNFAKSD